jgi:kynureninase
MLDALRNKACELDKTDVLAALRERFYIPSDKVYLDGNSLGVLPRAMTEGLARLVEVEWGDDLISSWNKHDWIDLPERLGERLAPLLGAAPGQVLCTDSISVNVFKLLATALALQPGRRVVLVEASDFPTDRYVADGLANLLGAQRCEVRAVAVNELIESLGTDVAVVLLSEVNYRTGRRHDKRLINNAAHAVGALTCWDVAHAAGAMPVEFDATGVDFAVGCSYKFLNGGPGAPGFLYVAKRHQNKVSQPLAGWLGHQAPFDFEAGYRPASGVLRYQTGTPSILAMRALDIALDCFDGVSLEQLRNKSLALSAFFIESLKTQSVFQSLRVITPEAAAERGSHVAICHEAAFALSQDLIARGVVGDFRAPNIIRFGFAPMYNTFNDALQALNALTQSLTDATYRAPRFQARAKVT